MREVSLFRLLLMSSIRCWAPKAMASLLDPYRLSAGCSTRSLDATPAHPVGVWYLHCDVFVFVFACVKLVLKTAEEATHIARATYSSRLSVLVLVGNLSSPSIYLCHSKNNTKNILIISSDVCTQSFVTLCLEKAAQQRVLLKAAETLVAICNQCACALKRKNLKKREYLERVRGHKIT